MRPSRRPLVDRPSRLDSRLVTVTVGLATAGTDTVAISRRHRRRQAPRVTEADIRLFVTLIRFDAAYHGLFKCNLRRIADYPSLSSYVGRVLAIPGVRDTVNFDHIKRGYYSIRALNPSGLVPVGPEMPELLAA